MIINVHAAIVQFIPFIFVRWSVDHTKGISFNNILLCEYIWITFWYFYSLWTAFHGLVNIGYCYFRVNKRSFKQNDSLRKWTSVEIIVILKDVKAWLVIRLDSHSFPHNEDYFAWFRHLKWSPSFSLKESDISAEEVSQKLETFHVLLITICPNLAITFTN